MLSTKVPPIAGTFELLTELSIKHDSKAVAPVPGRAGALHSGSVGLHTGNLLLRCKQRPGGCPKKER